MSLGLQRGLVKLSEYDPSWHQEFLSEKTALQQVIPDGIVEPVGSTAIPGIRAKPILDVMVGCRELRDPVFYEAPLQKVGYSFRTDARSSQEHILFLKGPEENRTHYLKLTTLNSNFWEEHILFRDFLIEHPTYVKEYESLKQALLDKHDGSRGPYTEGKKEFIYKILKLAGFKGR